MDKIKKSDHFYLIDGSGYIFRAYYALPPLTRKSDGLPVGAVSGFCNMLFKLIEDSNSKDNLQKPTHFAVIFDSARKNFRNEIKEILKMDSKCKKQLKNVGQKATLENQNIIILVEIWLVLAILLVPFTQVWVKFQQNSGKNIF